MLAHTPLQRQLLTEEGSNMRGNRCHSVFSSTKRSQACEMSSISCGVLSKYQYVQLTWAWPRYVDNASIWRPIWSRRSGLVSRTLEAKVWRKSISRGWDRSGVRGKPAAVQSCLKVG